eukprot:scaffold58149_cov59-Phaeocystis_antarctica.AAC.1
MLSFLVLSASLLMPRGRDVRPTDSSTPARSPASRMSNLPNGPASPSSTRTWLQKYMMHQLEEASCDGNVLMVDALLTADLLLFGVMKRQQYPDFNECYDVPRRGGYDLTSCIVDATDEGEVTPLVLAIRHENMDVINVFIEAGASLKGGRDENELTPLMYAIDTRNVNVIDALTAAGVSLEAECEDDHTPLEYAIHEGNVDVIKALIEAGASLEAECEDDLAPLEYAIHEGNVDVIKALIEAGASLEAECEDDYTPLEYAIDEGNVDVIKALIGAGASLEAASEEVCTPLEHAIKHDRNWDVINVLKDAERARSDTACLKAIFSEEYAMPDVELDFEPSHEGHVDLPWPPKAWISSASGEWRQVNLR